MKILYVCLALCVLLSSVWEVSAILGGALLGPLLKLSLLGRLFRGGGRPHMVYYPRRHHGYRKHFPRPEPFYPRPEHFYRPRPELYRPRPEQFYPRPQQFYHGGQKRVYAGNGRYIA